MGDKGESGEIDTVQAFTKRWLLSVNRGGLTFVSDEVYTLFYQMEMKMRKHLHELTSKKHVDVAVDDDVLFQWCLILMTNCLSRATTESS